VLLYTPLCKKVVRRRWTPPGGDRLRNPFAFTPAIQDDARRNIKKQCEIHLTIT
jgi:hypothetical protein